MYCHCRVLLSLPNVTVTAFYLVLVLQRLGINPYNCKKIIWPNITLIFAYALNTCMSPTKWVCICVCLCNTLSDYCTELGIYIVCAMHGDIVNRRLHKHFSIYIYMMSKEGLIIL